MSDQEQAAPQAGGDQKEGSKTKESSRPAGFKEWAMRFGAVGNFGMQCVNVALISTKNAAIGGFGGLNMTAKVGTGMIYASSGLGAAHSPVVIYKERLLTNEDTFRTALNGIREEQGRLAEQNDVLSAEIDDLQSEVDRMKDIENALRELADVQGSQLNELMDLVNQNKEINRGMRCVLKSKALEEVVSLVLDIDNDGSFTIQNKEIDRLIIGMKLIEEMNFNDKLFKADVVKCGGDIDKVIGLVKAMLSDDGGEEGGEATGCKIDIENPEDWFKKQKSKRDC